MEKRMYLELENLSPVPSSVLTPILSQWSTGVKIDVATGEETKSFFAKVMNRIPIEHRSITDIPPVD
jgi:hypothetical protein